jgi:hypothetical protein
MIIACSSPTRARRKGLVRTRCPTAVEADSARLQLSQFVPEAGEVG